MGREHDYEIRTGLFKPKVPVFKIFGKICPSILRLIISSLLAKILFFLNFTFTKGISQ